MLNTIIKLIISSGIIVLVSELAKKSTFVGGLVASIPLISVLAMIWLYIDTKDIENVINLSKSIMWMVVPSLALFITLPLLLKSGFNFYLSLCISIIITFFCYGLVIYTLGKIGIDL